MWPKTYRQNMHTHDTVIYAYHVMIQRRAKSEMCMQSMAHVSIMLHAMVLQGGLLQLVSRGDDLRLAPIVYGYKLSHTAKCIQAHGQQSPRLHKCMLKCHSSAVLTC